MASALGDIVAREIIEAFAVQSAGIKAQRLLGSADAKEEAMSLAQSFIKEETFELEIKRKSWRLERVRPTSIRAAWLLRKSCATG